MATDYPAPPFDDDPDVPDGYDDLFWDAVPVDRTTPAPVAVEVPAESAPEPVPVHSLQPAPAADEPQRPVSLRVEQSDVG